VILGLKLQGLVMLGLYVAGTVFAILFGWLLKKFFFKGDRPPLFMELPSYKWPSSLALIRGLVYRARVFVSRVGTVILALTVLIWFSVSFPKPKTGEAPSIETSYAAQMGHFIEPVLKPIGFDWKISMALIPSFAAREVLVSALSSIYAVEDTGDEDTTLQTLTEKIQTDWSIATGMSLLVWFIFAPQCFSTFAVARRELNSTPIALMMIAYLLVLAYLMSWITYRVFV
jgi:ferrous iron transport protein B